MLCPCDFSAWHELKGFKIKCIHWLTDDDRWFGFSIRSEGAGDIAVNSVHSCVCVTLLFTLCMHEWRPTGWGFLSYFHVMVSLCRCVWFLQIQQHRGGVTKLTASITENFWFISGGMMAIQLTQPCGWNVHTLLNAAICFGIGECEVHHNWAMYRKYKNVTSCEIQACNILWCFHVIACLPPVSHITNPYKSINLCQKGVILWHGTICACNGPNECLSVYPCHMKVDDLECVASADVLQFLRDLGWCSVQLFCHTFLLVRVHAVKLLTQISIYHILERKTEDKKNDSGHISRSLTGNDPEMHVWNRWKDV